MPIGDNPRIGWIGTGVMGGSMCGHLIDAGYSMTVCNRTREKAQRLLDKGATWADTPREVAGRSDVIFAIVGFPADVESVFLDRAARSACWGAKRETFWST